MDMCLEEAVEKFLQSGELHETVIPSGEWKQYFRKLCGSSSLRGATLVYKGRLNGEAKLVTNPQQVDERLHDRHMGYSESI